MNRKYIKIIEIYGVIICLISLSLTNAVGDSNENSVIFNITIDSFDVRETENGHEVDVDNFGRLLISGKPNMPSKIFSFAIPPGTEVTKVNINADEIVIFPGEYNVTPCEPPELIDSENSSNNRIIEKSFDENFKMVYGKNDPYPPTIGKFIRNSHYRRYNLVDIRVNPFTYYPQSGKLQYYPKITIEIEYKDSNGKINEIMDNLVRTEKIAEKLIDNYEQAQDLYQGISTINRGIHDYVIITLDSLTSSLSQLVNSETSKGRNVQVATTTWIDANYAGYDLQEKMRNFLRDKYPSSEWGIEDVLLVGHYDDVPMRRCEQDVGYGKPETDFYYAELSLPDDESWDANENHLYGENSDPIDFYGEVNVGRIPFSDPATVSDFCSKSVAYEQNSDPGYKNNILLLGAFFWADTDNAVLMEEIADLPHMVDWTKTRLYEEGYSSYPMDYNLDYNNVKSVWSSGTYGFVDWAGHGSPTACFELYPSLAFVNTGTCSYLNDDYPAIIFADACSNHDTDYFNIGQAMMQQGGVGFLGSTKVAFGMPGWNDPYDGSGQSLDYFFTSYVTSGNYTQGQAHQLALAEMYANGLWYYNKYETFEWGALLGNPNLGIGILAPLEIANVEANPSEQVNIGGYVNISCDVVGGDVVNSVKTNITYPDTSSLNQTMTNIPGSDTYFYNASYSQIGTYSYYIYADDIGGNSTTTEIQTFTVGIGIDQEQTTYSYDFAIYGSRYGAQSFKPTLDTLTIVELYVSQYGSPTNDLVVSIRDDPSGSDLTSVSVPVGDIPTSPDWVSFDLPDISVTPGSTYYIVMHTSGGSYSQCYKLGFAGGDLYADGSLRYSSDSGSSWAEYSTYDFCFRTYGLTGAPPTPVLSYSPASHDFGNMLEGVTDSTTFDIWNSGSGTLTYSLSESCGWVDISSTGGTSGGEHDTITVDIDTTGLSESAHSCNIDITSDGGSGTFTVDVTVIPSSPILSYSPASHDFGNMLEGVTDSTTFDIWNSGSGTLTYSLSESCGWVDISSTGGTSGGEHDTITVDIDTTGLSEDSHSCNIDITSDGGSGTFTVDITVVAGGVEELDQEQTTYSYDFAIYGSRYGAQSFKPTLDTLTRVELYVSQYGSPTNDLVVSIRDDPSGSDLTSVSVPAGDIPTSPDWVSFDLPDISVTPGVTYYMVMYTSGGSYSQCYKLGFAGGDLYADGSLRYSSDSGSSWAEYSTYDFTFKTYGGGGAPPTPVLSYSPASHDFGNMLEGVTDSTTFDIWNSGTGTLTYSLSESCGWVDISSTGGTSGGEHDTITVDIDTTGLSESAHSCNIDITSDGGSGTFTVDVTVIPSSPILSYSPASHDFGNMLEGVTDSTTFDIWNSGTGTLTYSLSESCGWVDISSTGGTSGGEHDTITVDIDTTGLSEDSHSCNIDITSDGGSGTFIVDVTVVAGGVEELDQEQTTYSYDFAIYGSRYGAQSFKPTLDTLTRVELYVSQYGSPTNDLVVSIRDDPSGSDLTSVSVPAGDVPTSPDWVSFDLPDISVTPGSTYYMVMYTSGGSYSQCYKLGFAGGDPYADGSLRYSSDSGSSWAEYSTYDFTFKTYGGGGAPPTPVLSYSPASHDFGNMIEGATDSTTFDIWNSGTGTLTYSLSESCGWVDISSTGGTSGGEHDTITVDIDTTGLSESAHSCNIDITSDGGSGTFTVDVTVIPSSPILSYSPASHDFGNMLEGVTDSTTFDIWNSGTGTLSYSLSESCGWVDISSTGGTSGGEHDTITVDIDTTGLSEDSHSCNIDITSDGGSGTFIVDVTVVAGGVEELDQEQTTYSYDFAIYGSRYGAQSFKPTLDTLTRVELYVSQYGSPTNDLVVSIRDDPSGSDLTSVSVPAGDVPTSPDWVSFDLPDISVTPGSTYYMVMYTSGGSYSQCYKLGFAGGDPYADGSLRYSNDAGSSWTEYTVYDFCFKIYGSGM